jgi:5-methylthioadenosine/S-adenosylhomocysteine deaminase
MPTLALTGVLAITMADPPLVPDATIVIEDGAFAAISTRGRRAVPARSFDGRGLIALPGLVNAHAHTLESFLRGCGGQLALLPWIRRTHAVMDQLDSRGAYLATRLATLEMLTTGTTAYLDPEIPTDHRFESMARAAADSGLRSGLTLLLEDRGGYHGWSDRGEPRLTDREIGLIERWHGAADGRLSTWVGPSVLSAITPVFARLVGSEAERRGLGIAFHCAEVPEDRKDTMARSGLGPVHFADRGGLLGERSVLTHGVDLDDEEIDLIARRGAAIVHCPTSNAKLGSGIAPLSRMLEAGATVALGTDGGSSNDTYDLFAEIRMAALIHRATQRDPAATRAEVILGLATAGGAHALRLPSGSLQPGHAADLTLLDATRTGSFPTADPVDSLVFATSSAAVRHVLVGGDWLLRDGAPVGLDAEAIKREAGEAARAAVEAAGLAADVFPPGLR